MSTKKNWYIVIPYQDPKIFLYDNENNNHSRHLSINLLFRFDRIHLMCCLWAT